MSAGGQMVQVDTFFHVDNPEFTAVNFLDNSSKQLTSSVLNVVRAK
jgi:hypothetical protein